MLFCRYRLIDREGIDLGLFLSSEKDWGAGKVIVQGTGSLRVLAVVTPETDEEFVAYLVVVQVDPVSPVEPKG